MYVLFHMQPAWAIGLSHRAEAIFPTCNPCHRPTRERTTVNSTQKGEHSSTKSCSSQISTNSANGMSSSLNTIGSICKVLKLATNSAVRMMKPNQHSYNSSRVTHRICWPFFNNSFGYLLFVPRHISLAYILRLGRGARQPVFCLSINRPVQQLHK